MIIGWIIYFTLSAAQTRNDEITESCHFEDGITNNYANVLAYPNKDSAYALPIGKVYEKYFRQDEIDSAVTLSSDWFITDTIKR